MNRMKRIGAAAAWLAVFMVASFAIMKLVFAAVCWIAGHDPVEAAVGAIAPIVFGGLIGIEAYLWFRDWRTGMVRERSRGQ